MIVKEQITQLHFLRTFYLLLEYSRLTMSLIVSGGWERDSTIHIHVYILSKLLSHPGTTIIYSALDFKFIFPWIFLGGDILIDLTRNTGSIYV